MLPEKIKELPSKERKNFTKILLQGFLIWRYIVKYGTVCSAVVYIAFISVYKHTLTHLTIRVRLRRPLLL